MNMFVKMVVVAGLGVGLGLVGAYFFFNFQSANTREGFFDNQWAPKKTAAKSDAAPKLTVDGSPTFDLGAIQTSRQVECEFIVRNIGNDALEFGLAGKLPTVLRTDLPADQQVRLPSQATYPITVYVTPTEIDSEFNKAIVLQIGSGNERLILTVTGKVSGGIVAIPTGVALQNGQPESSNPVQLNLFCWTADNLEVTDIKVEGRSEANWLKHSVQPVSSSLLAEQASAKSGVTITFELTPNFPPDAHSSVLLIQTNQAEFPTVRVPLAIAN